MKFNFALIFIASIIISISLLQNSAFCQRSKPSIKTSKVAKKNKQNKQKIISLGVVTGRAINLVKPQFPATASFTNVHGTVRVSIVIDELGNVIEANAIKGHILLIPNSLKAAFESKFKPFILYDGTARKVSGIIDYVFEANTLNWLEIGYNSLQVEKLKKYLPYEFESERQLIIQYKSADVVYKMEIFKNINSSIENKLQSNDKNFWLFKLGNEIRNFERSLIFDNKIEEHSMQNLLFEIPPGISDSLVKRVEKIIELSKKKDAVKTKSAIEKFVDNLYFFGN